jgi:pimeloyl-ACP methyl ester carboxylesterase
MALDHPDVVTKLAVLDIVPTGDVFDRADKDFALGYWVWSFLAAPAPIPETLIAQAPEVFVNHLLDSWSAADVFPPEIRAEYIRHFHDPDTVHAICAEYRAAAAVDHSMDTADRGVRRIACPVLALWDPAGAVAEWYGDPLEVWRGWADKVSGGTIPAGHFMAEEAPEETLSRLGYVSQFPAVASRCSAECSARRRARLGVGFSVPRPPTRRCARRVPRSTQGIERRALAPGICLPRTLEARALSRSSRA